MTDNRILSDEQRDSIEKRAHILYSHADKKLVEAAIANTEQAVLQSPQVRQWRKDAERYRAWRDAMLSENSSFLDELVTALPESPRISTGEDVDAAFDVVMEKTQ